MSNSQRYSVSRLYLQTYKSKPKKKLKSIRCRYLAKSQMIKANADNIKIEFTNFRGSNFKKITFLNTDFYGNDFWGTSFNRCNFDNASISHSIFVGCRFKDCSFKNTKFNNVIFVNTNLKEYDNINTAKGVTIVYKYPKVELSQELVDVLEILKKNKHLKKNKIFHLNKNRLNHLNLFLLVKYFPRTHLAKLLIKLNKKSCKNITTYKRLEKELKKIVKMI